MINYDPTLVALTTNFFDICTNVKDYLYYDNYSLWVVELSMNIHEGKGSQLFAPGECTQHTFILWKIKIYLLSP